MQAVDGNTMSGVEVATMIRSMSCGSQPAASSALRAASRPRSLLDIGRGKVARPDAGALHDPFVRGLDSALRQLGHQIGIGHPARGQITAGAGNAGIASHQCVVAKRRALAGHCQAPARGAACAIRVRTRSSRLLRAASYARFNACSNARSSAEPWLLNTRPAGPAAPRRCSDGGPCAF
jgi:hypothetical protein